MKKLMLRDVNKHTLTKREKGTYSNIHWIIKRRKKNMPSKNCIQYVYFFGESRQSEGYSTFEHRQRERDTHEHAHNIDEK